MSTLLKKSIAVFATAAILASTSAVTASAAVTEEPKGNYDGIVWVGAKDVKAKKDVDKFDTLMKSETFNHVGNYSGGKINVAVLEKGAASDAAAFEKLFTNGKLDATKAAAGKLLATAKYKDGAITVTAGKNPGTADVWVYEVKKVGKDTKIVNASNLPTGVKVSVNTTGSATVQPTKYEFTVKAAATSPMYVVDAKGVTAPTGSDKDNSAGTIATGDKAVNLAIKGSDMGKATIYIADKKVEASKENTWTILKEEKTKFNADIITISDSATIEYDSTAKAFKLTDITAKAEGKTTINIQNDQSGKVLKVNVVVTKWAKLTVGSGIKTKVDGGTETSDTTIYVAPKAKVTFDKKVKIDGKEYDIGKAVTITKDTTVEEVKAAS